jgi:hypothetical protein
LHSTLRNTGHRNEEDAHKAQARDDNSGKVPLNLLRQAERLAKKEGTLDEFSKSTLVQTGESNSEKTSKTTVVTAKDEAGASSSSSTSSPTTSTSSSKVAAIPATLVKLEKQAAASQRREEEKKEKYSHPTAVSHLKALKSLKPSVAHATSSLAAVKRDKPIGEHALALLHKAIKEKDDERRRRLIEEQSAEAKATTGQAQTQTTAGMKKEQQALEQAEAKVNELKSKLRAAQDKGAGRGHPLKPHENLYQTAVAHAPHPSLLEEAEEEMKKDKARGLAEKRKDNDALSKMHVHNEQTDDKLKVEAAAREARKAKEAELKTEIAAIQAARVAHQQEVVAEAKAKAEHQKYEQRLEKGKKALR